VTLLKLNEFIDSSTIEDEVENLPIFHTTLFENATNIFEHGIIPTYCNKLNDDLTYLFYGRNSLSEYGFTRIDIIKESDLKLAVSFGFDVTSLDESKIHSVFPFDSGAFITNRYSPHLFNSEDIYNYSFRINQIKKYLIEFFGSNENYIEGIITQELPIPSELEAFYRLVNDRTTDNFDTRCRTIEISTKQQLYPHEFKFLCIHLRLKRNSYVKKLLESNVDIIPIYYDTLEIGHKEGMYAFLQMKVKDYIRENLL